MNIAVFYKRGINTVSSIVILSSLFGCTKPSTPSAILQDRFSRNPETAPALQDGDLGNSDSRFNEELSHVNSDVTLPETEAEYDFLKGELLIANDQYSDALRFYKLAELGMAKPSAVLAKRIIQLTLKEGDLVNAVKVAETYKEKFPDDKEILEILAGAYAATSKSEESILIYKKLVDSSNGKKREEFMMLLASTYSQKKDYAGAKEVLKTLLKENSKNSLAIYYMGRMLELEGDLAGAEKRYRQAVKEAPENDGLQLELARLLAQTKKLKEAQEICKFVVARSPQNTLARQLLGQLLLATNNVDGALSQLETLQSLEQNPTDTRLRIALINLERRDFATAEKELNLVVAAKPNDGMSRYYLALACAGQNKVDEVVSAVSKISPKEKVFVESQLLASFVLKQEGRAGTAIEILKKADAELGENPDLRILNFLVSLEKDLDQKKEAILTQQKVIKFDQEKDSNYFMLAVLFDDIKDYPSSIDAGKKAIELNPKNAEALNFVGYSLADNEGDLSDAKKYVEDALKLEPRNGYFVDSLGWIYFKGNEFPEAVKELEKAVELVPTDSVILEHLAQAYSKVGEKEKALEIIKRALPNADKSDDKEVASRLKNLESSLREPANK